MSYTGGDIVDPVTGMIGYLDRFRNFKVANTKRIIGSNFGNSIDTTYLYTITNNNGGTATATDGVATLATNTTANGNTTLITKGKIRYLSGRNNNIRFQVRFGDTGGTNNVREFGIYVDANNFYGYRLSNTTFSIVTKKAGVETVVSSGSFNGNGNITNGTYTVDTNFHGFEILVSGSRIQFIIDNRPIHVATATTSSIVSSLPGQIYLSNTNSGGSTTNRILDILALSGSQIGDAVNNPQYYNIDAVAETRTLKAGGGTLQSISIGRLGGANALITIYDNTAGSGTIIARFDLTNNNAFGTHIFGIEGVNFYNGLTYVTSGTMTNGSVTIFWE